MKVWASDRERHQEKTSLKHWCYVPLAKVKSRDFSLLNRQIETLSIKRSISQIPFCHLCNLKEKKSRVRLLLTVINRKIVWDQRNHRTSPPSLSILMPNQFITSPVLYVFLKLSTLPKPPVVTKLASSASKNRSKFLVKNVSLSSMTL